MHTTRSELYSGNIDSIEYYVDYTFVKGWIVSISDKTLGTIRVVDLINNKLVKTEITFTQRLDVYEFYQKSSKKYLLAGIEIKIPKQIKEVMLVIDDEEIFHLYLNNVVDDDANKHIQKNQNTKPEIIIVDNFYKNPDEVRKYALAQEFYEEKDYYKGKRTKRSFVPDWIKPEFEKLLQKKITEFVGSTGIFQYCTARDSLVYHYDLQEYAAIVYLTPDAPLATGTSTYKSIHTGMKTAATKEDAQKRGISVEELDFKSFNGNNFYDKTNMELVDSIANVYNRLIIFNARSIHAASGYFGDDKENSRLFHLFFFNCSTDN